MRKSGRLEKLLKGMCRASTAGNDFTGTKLIDMECKLLSNRDQTRCARQMAKNLVFVPIPVDVTSVHRRP